MCNPRYSSSLFWKYRQYAQYTTYIITYTQYRQYAQYTTYIITYTNNAKHHSSWYMCERLYQIDYTCTNSFIFYKLQNNVWWNYNVTQQNVFNLQILSCWSGIWTDPVKWIYLIFMICDICVKTTLRYYCLLI